HYAAKCLFVVFLLNSLLATPLLPILAVQSVPTVSVINLRVEYKENPLGIDVLKPRLSWQLRCDRRGVMQSAFQIQVASTEHDLPNGRRLLWDSQKVNSDESVNRIYERQSLKSGRAYFWQVRVWDEKGVVSDWSETAHWETGLLRQSDWQAN